MLLYLPAFVVALVITMTEMTEVVAVVFALGSDAGTVRHGALGAVAGTAVVGTASLAAGAALLALPTGWLLWGSSIVLVAFGLFLFRSTLRSYRRARGPASAVPGLHRSLLFAGGFSVGAIETIEAVIVLLALSAAGYSLSAIAGALVGGAILVVLALQLHERIRRIKVPTLKLGATSLLFTFSVFWGGEAAGFDWRPLADLALVPLFVLALLLVRGALELLLRRDVRVQANS